MYQCIPSTGNTKLEDTNKSTLYVTIRTRLVESQPLLNLLFDHCIFFSCFNIVLIKEKGGKFLKLLYR